MSVESFSAETWPDGTPKKYRGRDAWKNWIDFDSPHKAESDELNRKRHYFFHVDARGRLWRKELHRLHEHDGQLRDSRLLDYFFGHMQRNRTGLHEENFRYVSLRAHEHYFTSCIESPVVFNDLRDGELRHICPDGALASSISTKFEPSKLQISLDGKLLHPVVTRAVDTVGARPRSEVLLALIESSTAQMILEHCEEYNGADAEPGGAVVLRWGATETLIHPSD